MFEIDALSEALITQRSGKHNQGKPKNVESYETNLKHENVTI